jgi:acyl-CoA thioester hydrolase
VAHVGRSSVVYEVALFGKASETAAAQGRFVHVYVDRETRRPVAELPAVIARAVDPLRVPNTNKEPS